MCERPIHRWADRGFPGLPTRLGLLSGEEDSSASLTKSAVSVGRDGYRVSA